MLPLPPSATSSRALVLCAALATWTACNPETNGEQSGAGAGFNTGNIGGSAPCVDDIGCDEATVANGSGGGLCFGTPTPCAAFSGTEACGSVKGCTADHQCQGAAQPCGAMGEAGCNGQIGCLWQFVTDGVDFCSGSASDCESLAEVQCQNQAGCQVEVVCTGDPTSCASISNTADCQAQPGCRVP